MRDAAGSRVHTAGFTSGEAGLAALRAERFDLLLADLMMPGMDGITLLHEALKIDPSLGCIVMTGAGTVSTAVQAMKAGAFDFILKPFKLGVILPVLERAFENHRLRLRNARLEKAVRLRSRQLARVNRELREASRHKSEFLANMSHELRTPLNSIIGFTEFIIDGKSGPLTEKQKSQLEMVHGSGRHLLNLINDLLDVPPGGWLSGAAARRDGPRPLPLQAHPRAAGWGDHCRERVRKGNALYVFDPGREAISASARPVLRLVRVAMAARNAGSAYHSSTVSRARVRPV
jgi:CheY-like chemotaxis protein